MGPQGDTDEIFRESRAGEGEAGGVGGALVEQFRVKGAQVAVNGEGECRIRVGAYRVVYDIEDDELTILVLRIGPRSDVYR